VTVRLEELLAAATPGPWHANPAAATAGQTIRTRTNNPVARLLPDDRDSLGGPGEDGARRARAAIKLTQADASLMALAPDAVRLLIDTTKALRDLVDGSMWECPFCGRNMEHDGHKDECEYAALLARLDRLGNTT